MKPDSTNWPVLLFLAGPANLVEETSVKEALGILSFTFACGLIAYGAGHWDWLRTSEQRERIMWLAAFGSLPWSVGILAAKFVWRFDEQGQPMYARWHWGQVVMATIAMILLAGVGMIGFTVTLVILSDCPVPDWNFGCTVGTWAYGFLGIQYGVLLLMIAPFALWWDSFHLREQRTKGTSETDVTRAYEAGRRDGRDESIRRLRRKVRPRKDVPSDRLGGTD